MYINLLISLTIIFIITACTASTSVISEKPPAESELTISILYDNYTVVENTKADWGFSCLIETPDSTILFDTGTNSEILLHNSKILKVNLSAIDQIFISHNHPDHIGGLDAILQANSGVSVYFPISVPVDFAKNIAEKNSIPIGVDKPIQIAKHVYSTGEMGNQIKEQSLILDTRNGLIIVTGCSHQGIINIIQLAKNMFNKKIILVLGGLHLEDYDNVEIEKIIGDFKEFDVQQCGASHCTGDLPLKLFENSYGENFIPMGVGKVLRLPY